MQELELAVVVPLVKVAVLPTAQREGVPVVNIAAHHRHDHRLVRVDKPLDLLLLVSLADRAEQVDERAVVVLPLVGALHPLGTVASRVVGVLVPPVGIPVLARPAVGEPPFVVDAVQVALHAIGEVAVQEIIGDRLDLLAHLWRAAVDREPDHLVFIHHVPHQVQHIAGHPVAADTSVGVVVPRQLVFAAKPPVVWHLPLAPVHVVTPRPRAAAVAHLTVVPDIGPVGDERRIEIVIRQAREFVIVLGAAAVADRLHVVVGDDEAHVAQIRLRLAVVDDVQRRAGWPPLGLPVGRPLPGSGFHVKLHAAAVGAVLGQRTGVEAVAGHLIPAPAAVVIHRLGLPRAGVV